MASAIQLLREMKPARWARAASIERMIGSDNRMLVRPGRAVVVSCRPCIGAVVAPNSPYGKVHVLFLPIRGRRVTFAPHPRNWRSRKPNAERSKVSHSHMMMTSQPFAMRAARLLASRALFRRSLADQ